jgi:drug/metabolite transporter (DMT)-like permease
MKELSPFTVSMSINMEPLYAILLALLFFGDDELMSSGFYLGASIVFLAVLTNAYIKMLIKKKAAKALQ